MRGRGGNEAVRVDASTSERLPLAQMKVHRFANQQVPPAHFGFWRDVLRVGAGSSGLLAKVRNNQKRVGIVECG